MKFTTRVTIVALSVAETVLAHSGMTNFYVNGKNQGDAVCVRMNTNPSKWNSPIADITGPDLACGYDGTVGVNRVCPVPDGATITFEYRQSANKPGQGVIDPSHKGPCTVYAKKVNSAISDKATGDGWFKLWHEGYDEAAGKWCTEKLIASNGLMSVTLPKGLVGGSYLLRSEILALHVATQGDPQYYVGCAQVFLESSGNLGPVSTVAIPGIVSKTDKSDSFNIYESPMKLPYPIPGPELATFKAGSAGTEMKQTEGSKPAGCIDESGSNFCGTEIPEFTTQADCWKSAEACWAQADLCWKSVPATGIASCEAWQTKCKGVQSDCEAKRAGPANKGKDITPVKKDITPPAPLGGTSASGGSVSSPSTPNSAKPASSVVAAPSAVIKVPMNDYPIEDYPAPSIAPSSAAPPAASMAPIQSKVASALGAIESDSTTTTTITNYRTATVTASSLPSAVANSSGAKEGNEDDSSCGTSYDDDEELNEAPVPQAEVKAPAPSSSSAAPQPQASATPGEKRKGHRRHRKQGFSHFFDYKKNHYGWWRK